MPTDNVESRRPWVVAVAGLMGAGKTTLATQLARGYGWSYIPRRRIAGEYIRDLFSTPNRWAFEAQLAMFCSKAVEINEQLEHRRHVIVDRSLEEDLGVFACYFYKLGHIDERAYSTYTAIADEFLRHIGPPDVTIYCQVPPDIAWSRILQRKRGEEINYPVDHVRHIAAEYSRWIETYDSAPTYALDSVKYDWRVPKIAETVADDLAAILENLVRPTAQIGLFENDANQKSRHLAILESMSNARNWRSERPESISPGGPRLASVRRRAYLAAPFTSAEMSFPDQKWGQIEIQGLSGGHGRIPPGPYRSALLALATKVREQGFDVLLPHRDVNKWGELQLSPDQVTRACTEHVTKCDVFIGILGQSCGSHYEFGLAMALRKPCLILAPEDTSHSFIAQGVSALAKPGDIRNQVLVVRTASLEELPALLERGDVVEFLRSVPQFTE